MNYRWNGLFLALALALVGAPAWAGETVHVVLKFVKETPGATVAFVPESCPSCVEGHDPAFARDNARETLVELTVPRRRTLELGFRMPARGIRRVILETGDIPFSSRDGQLHVSLPPLGDDAVDAGEFSTHIVEPGMVLRMEHADPERRAGPYAKGDFPTLQRHAADTLEFAEREVIRLTGLGDYVVREKIGTIQVMGFDTNFPHGHKDAPPHIHMHLRWPGRSGTQIGHYFIDERGLLASNRVTFQNVGAAGRTFDKGETFTTVDRLGRPVYAHMITPEGWLRLGRAGQAPCLVRPVSQGFDSGAMIECPDRPAMRLTVTDDLRAGVVTVRTDAIVETLRYDVDTGQRLSPDAAPPVAPSIESEAP